MSSWISVWDEMPEVHEVVIIRVRDDYCVAARLITEFDDVDESAAYTAWGENNREEEVHHFEDIEYWMRIPKLPENKA